MTAFARRKMPLALDEHTVHTRAHGSSRRACQAIARFTTMHSTSLCVHTACPCWNGSSALLQSDPYEWLCWCPIHVPPLHFHILEPFLNFPNFYLIQACTQPLFCVCSHNMSYDWFWRCKKLHIYDSWKCLLTLMTHYDYSLWFLFMIISLTSSLPSTHTTWPALAFGKLSLLLSLVMFC